MSNLRFRVHPSVLYTLKSLERTPRYFLDYVLECKTLQLKAGVISFSHDLNLTSTLILYRQYHITTGTCYAAGDACTFEVTLTDLLCITVLPASTRVSSTKLNRTESF